MSERIVCDEWADDFRAKLKEKERAKDTRIAELERNLALVDKALSNTMASALALESQLAERTRERDAAIKNAEWTDKRWNIALRRAESAEQRERELREALTELLAADYAIKGDIVSDDYHAMALRWSRAKDAARAALAPAQQEGGE